ncbi:MAG TPA: photosynthetic reaction center cytochrome c subunit family protein [Pyrinomonadaceae bacterium]|nr:photosynthetic reaction center cytochrome c subunit family protein [Pyrinomonadaceae bacterium]
MKLTILRLLIVALSCACGVMLIANLRAPKAAANGKDFAPLYTAIGMPQAIGSMGQTPATAAQEQTIAQEGREKNVKLLGDLPVSQFIPVMNYFAVSMGRRCNFCHVNNNGQWDYASDAKPEKNNARAMIKLVLDTNKTLSGLKLDPIACYTCHRGRNNPQSGITLPLAVPSPPPGGGQGQARPAGTPAGPGAAGTPGAQPQGSPTPRPTPTPADEIIGKYVTAIGGQANIDKVKSRTLTGSSTNGAGNPIPFEILQAPPNKFYIRATVGQGVIERGFDGQAGWEKSARGVRQLDPVEISRLQGSINLWGNLKLKEQYTRLRTVGRDKVGDRDTYVILATRSETESERLFFDIETGLLLRRITYLRTMIGTIPEQFDFEDYREVDGVKLPFTVRVSSVDAGNPVATRTFSEMKLNTPADESKFKMPAATP